MSMKNYEVDLRLDTLFDLVYDGQVHILTRRFINKRAPGILELDDAYGRPMKDGEYLWEKTAGTVG